MKTLSEQYEICQVRGHDAINSVDPEWRICLWCGTQLQSGEDLLHPIERNVPVA